MLNDLEKKSFAEALLKTFDLRPLDPVDQNLAINNLIEEVNECLSLNDDSKKEERFNHFNIPGTKPNDYSEKLFEINGQEAILAGIRHLGGNPHKPFIAIRANHSLDSYRNLSKVASIVQNEFSVFKPAYMSIWVNHQFNLIEDSKWLGEQGQKYLAGRTEHLHLDMYASNEIQLIRKDLSHYWNWYEKQYQEFHEDHPHLSSLVPMNEFEEMKEAEKDGLLFFAMSKKEPIGIIAGKKEELLGINGVYMIELLLSRAYRGKGLCQEFENKFINQLPNDIDLIWGTIDSKNIPSLKVAEKIGRKVVRKECFIPIKDVLLER